MKRPSPVQLERARRLLAHEGAAANAGESATAAGRVYDKLHAHLAPLVGASGVHALFVRSAKLTQDDFAGLPLADAGSLAQLRECLQAQDPAVSAEWAAALFGTFLALLATFIGERLTSEVLRSAWPTIEEAAPTENKK
ncbi:MAG: hypothetical protein ACHQ17_15125 [Polyangia bacterium]